MSEQKNKAKLVKIDQSKIRHAKPKIAAYLERGKIIDAIKGIVDTLNYAIDFIFYAEVGEADGEGGNYIAGDNTNIVFTPGEGDDEGKTKIDVYYK